MNTSRGDWGPLWEKAAARYREEREAYEEEHSSWFSRHRKKKKKDGETSQSDIPVLQTGDEFAKVFTDEVEQRRKEFSKMRSVGAGVADEMLALSTPLKALLDQASAVGGMFFPGTPMIYSGVIYLFDACKGVTGYFDVIEQLLTQCHKFINNISIHINRQSGAPIELRDTIVRCFISFIDICRLTTKAAKEKKLKAWFEQLRKDKGNEARVALQNLQDLAQERDSTVTALTLRSVDNIENDVVEVKTNVIEIKSNLGDVNTKVTNLGTNMKEVSETQTQLILQLIRQSSRGDADMKISKDAIKDSKKSRERKARDALRKFLDPDIRTRDRLKELQDSMAIGTCKWILERQEYKDLLNDRETHILWISGASGVGKSHLMAKIVQHIKEQLIVSEEGAIKPACTSYFCDFDEDSGHDSLEVSHGSQDGHESLSDNTNSDSNSNSGSGSSSDSDSYDEEAFDSESDDEEEDDQGKKVLRLPVAEVIKTLAWCLADEERTYENHLAQRQSAIKNGNIQELWGSLFDNGYFTKHTCFLVIDGLNMIPEKQRKMLYDCLQSLVSRKAESKLPLKIVLSGRQQLTEELEGAFGKSLRCVEISPVDNHDDIDMFIRSSLSNTAKFKRVWKDPNFVSNSVNMILRLSQGNFELAALLTQEIQQKDHFRSVQESLSQSYRSLDEVIAQTLQYFGQRHESQDIEDFNRFLTWALYAERPMTLAELNIITGVESGMGGFLDIRDKIKRDFSSYISISEINRQTRTYQEKNEDDQPDLDQDDGQDIATIKLAHSSISEFFYKHEKTAIKGKGVAIGVSEKEAHIRILKTCLDVICDTTTSTSSLLLATSKSVLQYAATHLTDHLDFLMKDDLLASIDATDLIYLARRVIRLFRDELIIARWWFLSFDNRWPHWYTLAGPLKNIWKLVSHSTVRKSLPSEDKAWIDDSSTTICDKLLRHPARFVATSWLGQIAPSLVVSTYYRHLEAMIELIKLSNEQAMVQPTVLPYAKKWKFLPYDQILSVAQWAKFEKSPVWYVQVGSLLRGKDGAMNLYKSALAIDPNFGPAHFGLAMKYAFAEDYEAAIKEMKEAHRLKFFAADDSGNNSATKIAEWLQEIDRPQEALQILEAEVQERPNNFSTLYDFVWVSFTLERYSEIILTLQNIDSLIIARFLNYDSDINEMLRKVVQHAKRIDFLKSATVDAIEQARIDRCDSDDITGLKMCLAAIYAENQEDDNAIEQLREVYELDAVSPQPSADAQWCEGWLASLLYFKLCSLRRNSTQYHTLRDELVEMEKQEHSPFDGHLSADKYDAGLYLGRLLLHEKNEVEAHTAFRDRIALGLELLDDDNLDNDIDAWGVLAFTLSQTGDYINGQAAFLRWAKEKSDDDDDDDDDDGDDDDDDVETEKTKDGDNDDDDDNDVGQDGDNDQSDDQDDDGDDSSTTEGSDNEEELSSKDVQRSSKSQTTDAKDHENTNEGTDVSEPKTSTKTTDSAKDSPTIISIGSRVNVPHTKCDFEVCDGPCNTDLEEEPKKAYICSVCYYTIFCEDCRPLLENNTLPYKRCDPAHKLLPITLPPKGVEDAMLVVDGVVEEVDAWKDKIRRNWDLSKVAEKHAAGNGDAVIEGDI